MTDHPTDPWTSGLMTLQEDWIDYNGHLNMAFYNVLFDKGCDGYFERLGLGPEYIKTRNLTFYTAEAHIRYLREVHLGDRVRVEMRMLDHDAKRVHGWAELIHEDGWISATSETMSLHIDMVGPKVSPFPGDIAEAIAKQAKHDATLPKPDKAGQPIGIRRK